MRLTLVPNRLARLLLAVLGVALAAYLAFLVLNLPDPTGRFWDHVYNLIELGAAAVCLMRGLSSGRREGLAWVLLAVGMFCFAIGDVYWTQVLKHSGDHIPVPSPADIGYLLFYPFAYAALVVLVRARGDRAAPGLWLEGAIASFAVAAIGAALLQKPIQAATGGTTKEVATSLAYPLADILLFSLVVAVLTLTGRRKAGTWFVAALGFAIFAATDAVYGYQNAAGTYVDNTILIGGWPAAFVLFAFAAWLVPARVRTSRLDGWQSAVLPGVLGLTSLGVLVYGALHHVYAVAVALAAGSLVAVIGRMGLLVSQRLSFVANLGASEERYRALVRSLPDTIITLYDRDLKLIFFDGAGIDDAMHQALARGGLRGADIAEPAQRPELNARFVDALAGDYSTHEISFPSTTGRQWALEIGPYCPDGVNVDGVFCVARNVTGRKQAERELEHQALHDALTGLANRVLFMDRLDQALARL
ncbi:MAG: diguanylate cyclase, partial [Thermoleophilaceae bacterium]|nr:diguanylate cyclase [Thermoleophilaceae bacterium]